MTSALQAAAGDLRRTVTMMLAIIGTTISLIFGHSLDGALLADSGDSAATSAISSAQVVGTESAAPALQVNDADLCAVAEPGRGIVLPRALIRQPSALTVLTFAPRIRRSVAIRYPEAPPRPVTLTALCISQT